MAQLRVLDNLSVQQGLALSGAELVYRRLLARDHHFVIALHVGLIEEGCFWHLRQGCSTGFTPFDLLQVLQISVHSHFDELENSMVYRAFKGQLDALFTDLRLSLR